MNVNCSAEVCPVILNSICVFYEGANLVYTGIVTNDNLQTALEKIDAKFQDAGLGYIFNNGVIQSVPGNPVQLGGSLIQDTIITSGGYNLTFTGNLIAGAHVTSGGTSSQFVKGDGSLDNTSYQPVGNYITALTGDGSASGPGSATFTLSNTGVIANTYGNATHVPVITVDAKGRITNATTTLITVPSGLLFFGGDVSGNGVTGTVVTLTLQTVNSNVYASNTALKFAVNGKGLVTSAAPLTNLDIFSIIGYTPVPQTRTLTINGQTYDLSANRSWTVSGLPSQTGNAGKFLTTDGSTASWASLPPSGVTNVTATSPITSSGGATPNISTSMNTNKLIGRGSAGVGVMEEITLGTGLSLSGTTLNATAVVTPAALTKVDDTNVTLTLGGSPSTALLQATSLTLGWTGTLADSRIASASTWNAKQDAISLTTTGTSGPATFIANTLNIPQYTDQFTGTVTSVGLSMPSAFTVTNSPVTTSGTINVTGAGLTSQYIRGDGSLANFPSTGGGGGGTVYYLNGNTNQGVFSGITMYQMSRVAGTGAAANFTRNTVGTIASFITDAGDPNQLTVPAGIWIFQCYLSETGGGSNHAQIQAVVEKWDGASITVISTGPLEEITNGNTKDLYQFGVTIPAGTTLSLTDRIVVQINIANPQGKTVTLYTEDSDLGSVTTTFANGISSLNGLTATAQTFATGTTGTDFGISSSGSIHTFNIPTASASNRGLLSTSDWTTFNNKVTSLSAGTGISIGGTTTVPIVTNTAPDQTVALTAGTGIGITGTYPNFTITNSSPSSGGTVTSVAALTLGTSGTDLSSTVANGTTTPVITLNVPTASSTNRGALSSTDWSTFNGKIGGSGTTNEIAYFTASGTIASLTTGTYPSLTELSYVKGASSNIQNQINAINPSANYLFLNYNFF